MMDANRIKELAVLLRSLARDFSLGGTLAESAAALDELARIKSAAQNEVVEKIAGNHKADAESTDTVYAYRHKQPHKDRGILLDALRAKEAEREVMQEQLRTVSIGQLIAKCTADQFVNDIKIARLDLDEARAQLAQAQKEIERLTSIRDAQVQDLARADERERVMRLEIEAKTAEIAHLSETRMRLTLDEQAIMEERDRLRYKLAQAERDKAALIEGVQWYRMESPPFAQPVQIARWERDHGALAPRDGEIARHQSCPCPQCFKCCCAQIPELASSDCVNAADGVCDCARRDNKPVCSVCNDTHRMEQPERLYACTYCPTPCAKCSGTRSAYCAVTPCLCECHRDTKPNKEPS